MDADDLAAIELEQARCNITDDYGRSVFQLGWRCGAIHENRRELRRLAAQSELLNRDQEAQE